MTDSTAINAAFRDAVNRARNRGVNESITTVARSPDHDRNQPLNDWIRRQARRGAFTTDADTGEIRDEENNHAAG